MPYGRKRNLAGAGANAYANRYSKKAKKTSRKTKFIKKVNDPRDTKAVTLVYTAGNVNQALASATASHVIYRVNDMTTASGLEGLGRDQYLAIYKQAYVKGSAAELTVGCPAENCKLLYAMWFDKDVTAPGSYPAAIQRAIACGGKYQIAFPAYPGTNQVSGKLYVKTTTYEQNKSGFENSDNYTGLTDTPSDENLYYLHQYVYNLDGVNISASTTGLNKEIVIKQDVLFINPNVITVS